jgi:hypothetical protein
MRSKLDSEIFGSVRNIANRVVPEVTKSEFNARSCSMVFSRTTVVSFVLKQLFLRAIFLHRDIRPNNPQLCPHLCEEQIVPIS